MKLNLKLNFIKKIKIKKHYLIIGGILLLTLFICLYLLGLITLTEEENKKVAENIKRTGRRLKSINYYKPTPSSNNIDLINKDASFVRDKLFEMKTKFGNPYMKPLCEFVTSLKKNLSKKADVSNSNDASEDKIDKCKSLESFLKSWENYFKKHHPKKKTNSSNKATFSKFLQKSGYSSKDYDNALNMFTESLQRHSFTKISKVLAEDFFMNSIGFPLSITRIQCKELISQLEKRINQKLYENKIQSSSQKLILFDEFTTMPNNDQIPYIINYLWFYQDLVSKIINSNIESMPVHTKLNGLRGTKKGKFTVLRYEIEVIASLESIRSFINKLQKASENNRVYSVDYVSFVKAIDNATKLRPPAKRKRQLDIKIVIGTSKLIRSKIRISYYIYNKKLVKL
ncbi:MAG: hypothetical protein K9L78_00105 [Victivallales bacterium]|nr:hypothetical protein [Victivallales bacterium]MCF7888498.1 hypothetical protein [Victivallales bacterium]